jgi:uncharacterized protein involved in propanediol utilization
MAIDPVHEVLFSETAGVIDAVQEGAPSVPLGVAAAFHIGLHVGIMLDRGYPEQARAVLQSLQRIQVSGGNDEVEESVRRFVAAIPSRAN